MSEKTFHTIRVFLFSIVFIGFSILGLLMFLRPTESELEKRKLQQFPKFTISSFLDGSYCSDISLWYSDTYPFRELLLTAQSYIEQLYGVQKNTLHGDISNGDKIPSNGLEFPSQTPEDPSDSSTEENPEDTTEHNSEASSEETSETRDQNQTGNNGSGEILGTVYLDDNIGYPIFYFSLENTNLYLNTIYEAGNLLKSLDNVYVLAAPTSSGYLDEETIKKTQGSSQKDTLDYINGSLANASVTPIEVFDILGQHSHEYIYFKTDHHWTALGAYYAYTAFAKAKGITPNSLSDFETMEFDNFVGSLYSANGKLIPSLKNNPDTIIAYVPKGTNLMHVTSAEGQQFKWPIVNDVSDYVSSQKYSAFVAGDNPYSYIQNPAITDGSSCLIIKESYANAFIPFLVDHYETIHIIDYRSYDGNILDFIAENSIQDIIFLNNLEAINSKYNINLLRQRFGLNTD